MQGTPCVWPIDAALVVCEMILQKHVLSLSRKRNASMRSQLILAPDWLHAADAGKRTE